ncbi:hypothetical protein BDF20DRAFT_671296 [Mycotypha africana]|uniref:uncharacterized protein n=1 Tax=Mycotypha africana TaxID=64632 RepID=UPI0023017588|nr:uncharacterized protein BDF20DRAFT_671296 [Mycotypha africana]KAI8973762.1 hypothetical protein BDF20DRAFT_671296 [Mycotypha africana]
MSATDNKQQLEVEAGEIEAESPYPSTAPVEEPKRPSLGAIFDSRSPHRSYNNDSYEEYVNGNGQHSSNTEVDPFEEYERLSRSYRSSSHSNSGRKRDHSHEDDIYKRHRSSYSRSSHRSPSYSSSHNRRSRSRQRSRSRRRKSSRETERRRRYSRDYESRSSNSSKFKNKSENSLYPGNELSRRSSPSSSSTITATKAVVEETNGVSTKKYKTAIEEENEEGDAKRYRCDILLFTFESFVCSLDFIFLK